MQDDNELPTGEENETEEQEFKISKMLCWEYTENVLYEFDILVYLQLKSHNKWLSSWWS